jgi:sodium transport system permease protein
MERFGGIAAFTAFTINQENQEAKIVEAGKEAGFGLSFMMPMLLNIMLFAGAMGIGIDVIAGEKERGTMATMLLTPVNRETIAMGKVLSLGIVAVISALCTFGAIIASLPNAANLLAAGNEVSLAGLAFSPMDYIMLLVILIVQVGIFVGLICLISVIAKSVKEAGTYISPIYILVMISAFATVFTSGNVKMFNYFIPVLGNVFAIKELLLRELSYMEFGVTVGISITLILVLLKFITLAFNNEKIMLN